MQGLGGLEAEPPAARASGADLPLNHAMTADQFDAARATLGLSDDHLAADMGVTPDIVRAWSSGAARIPPRYAQHLAWLVAAHERQAALAASGLPECDWLTSHSALSPGASREAMVKDADAVMKHLGSCSVCLARQRYVDQRFGPMPGLPRPAWLVVFEWIERIPPSFRPAVVGASLLAAATSVRVILAIPSLFSNPGRLAAALVAVAAAGAAGAVGGFAYSLTRPSLKALGRPGDYVSGMVAVGAYMGAIVLAAPFAFGRPIIEGTSDLVIFAILTVAFGLFVGHHWLRPAAE